VEFVGDRYQSTVDRNAALLEVDIVPAEAEQFAPAHPGGGENPEGREQPMTCRSLQKRV
jgi:hypothetical protein